MPGIHIQIPPGSPVQRAAADALDAIQQALTAMGLVDALQATWDAPSNTWQFGLTRDHFDTWTPGHDSLNLRRRTAGITDTPNASVNLLREIWIALLASPVAYTFPSIDELLAAVRVRRHTVVAARLTSMDFQTGEAHRPADCWSYDEDTGFVLKPDHALIPSLEKAMQPSMNGGHLYAFSCYRATEYVLLLALAREAAGHHPELLRALTRQWQQQSVQSGLFHDVFLREYGSVSQPLPLLAYVPGDRVWFRNPDDASSDVAGYEGSWVVYLGNRAFPNFWNIASPFSLESKCVEVYHWRHGLQRRDNGELYIDESIVSERTATTLANPDDLAQVLGRMQRLRDPQGVYAEGGCMDASRESLRWVCPGTSDITLPGRR